MMSGASHDSLVQNELDFARERSIAVHVNRGRPDRLLP